MVPRGELVDGQAGLQPGAAVLQAVSDGVGDLQDGVRSGLLKVVTTDGDGVELGHVLETRRAIKIRITSTT